MKLLVLAVCVSLCGACSAHHAPRASSSLPASADAKGGVPDDPPAVRVQVDLTSETGIVSMWCKGSRCAHHDGARPRRYLPLPESGLVVFATGQAPEAARVEADGEKIAVRPGTTMAAILKLAKGAHTVTLIASWPGREAHWLFGVRAA